MSLESGTDWLKKQSPCYKRYGDEIHSIAQWACTERYKMLSFIEYDDVIAPQKGIVCGSDTGASVASLYRREGIKVVGALEEPSDPESLRLLYEKIEMLHKALAIRLSIINEPNPARSAEPDRSYEENIRLLDKLFLHCIRSDLPPPLPHLFTPSALLRGLQQEPRYHEESGEVEGMYEHLAGIFRLQFKSLETIAHVLQSRQQFGMALRFFENVARKRNMPVYKMLEKNGRLDGLYQFCRRNAKAHEPR